MTKKGNPNRFSLVIATGLLAASCSDSRRIEGSAARDDTAAEYYAGGAVGLPFSPAVSTGDLIFLSGQIGINSGNPEPADIKTQTKNAMDNLAANLALAGATMESVVKCTVMLDDISQWAQVNEVYVTYFNADRMPARSAFGADGLAYGAALEIECIAVAPQRNK